MKKEEEENKRAMQEKLDARASVVVYRDKKPVMPRSEKPATKKKEEKKQVLTPEQIDMAKYLG